jgi:hypothetical protein
MLYSEYVQEFRGSFAPFAVPFAAFAVKMGGYALIGFLPQSTPSRRKGHRGNVV